MDCKQVRKNLSAFIDKELDNGLMSAIKSHLDACSSCNKELKLLSKSWDLLDKYPSIPYRAQFAGELRGNIESIKNSRPVFFGNMERWQKIAVSVAAGLVLVFGAWFYINKTGANPDNNSADQNVVKEQPGVSDSIADYYKDLVTYYDSIKNEDYWKEDDVKALSPYLFSGEELF